MEKSNTTLNKYLDDKDTEYEVLNRTIGYDDFIRSLRNRFDKRVGLVKGSEIDVSDAEAARKNL